MPQQSAMGLLALLLFVPDAAVAQAGWVRRYPTTIAVARGAAGTACDEVHGQLLMLFGYRSGSVVNDGWLWNGAAWTPMTGALPPPRTQFAMTWDANRQRVVLVGGYSGTAYLNDLWEWDGAAWSGRMPSPSPAVRRGHALGCDRDRGVLVLFGGYNGSLLDDTWEWNGNLWRQVLPARRPSPRDGAQMTFDPAGGGVLLYGGFDGNHVLDETWSWDGSSWRQHLPPMVPYMRSTAGFVSDLHRRRVVLYGGNAADAATWEWDGAQWHSTSLPGPGPRQGHVMGYDSVRRETVLFGGMVSGSSLANDTWVYRTDAVAEVTAYGTGCAGSGGPPLLTNGAWSLPWVGSTLTMRAARLAPSVNGLVFVTGFTSTLPFDLGPFGMPGCSSLVAPFTVQFAAVASGAATWSLMIPGVPALAGTHLFQQVFAFEPGANAAGIVVSNGSDIELGIR